MNSTAGLVAPHLKPWLNIDLQTGGWFQVFVLHSPWGQDFLVWAHWGGGGGGPPPPPPGGWGGFSGKREQAPPTPPRLCPSSSQIAALLFCTIAFTSLLPTAWSGEASKSSEVPTWQGAHTVSAGSPHFPGTSPPFPIPLPAMAVLAVHATVASLSGPCTDSTIPCSLPLEALTLS